MYKRLSSFTFSSLTWSDWSAIGLSGLCLIHCLAATLLLGLAPALAVGTPHALFFAGALALALWSLGRGVRLHKDRRVLWLGAAGLSLMSGGLWLPHSSLWDALVTGLGVIVLAAAHGLNSWQHHGLRCRDDSQA